MVTVGIAEIVEEDVEILVGGVHVKVGNSREACGHFYLLFITSVPFNNYVSLIQRCLVLATIILCTV